MLKSQVQSLKEEFDTLYMQANEPINEYDPLPK